MFNKERGAKLGTHREVTWAGHGCWPSHHDRVMKTNVFGFVVVIACGHFCGCTKSPTRPFPSEAELSNAVPAGLTKAELVRRYGKPFIAIPEDNGPEWIKYMAPGLRDEIPTNWQYTGFSVTLTNGKVAFVGASHRGVTKYRSIASSEGSNTNNEPLAKNTRAAAAGSISFHEIKDDPIPGGRYLDTQNLPKAGYIRDQPDLVVTEIISVERGQEVFGTGSNDVREVLNVILTDTDAKHFAKLTETLLGKRLLISVGTEAVVAPAVLAPIQNGSFTLNVQDPAEAQKLFERIRGLARK